MTYLKSHVAPVNAQFGGESADLAYEFNCRVPKSLWYPGESGSLPAKMRTNWC
ncbi:MAG: hypothetical protein H6581_04100 [Bacteroidia bacterium]|nr:hypothetical protein [Bacteroidia bacterium]